uniref:PUB domain-containing protein n=1 Tax=Octactis speculum TaxID=3111310 RepID=A0A7S2BWR0_9STRA|mmetsp:Transcript_27736/g.37996  ORF Transcript_27736/g.37996 Transcript_27736/m.37996 type:complete len:177 (+) Transcript_27736:96-626(+)
MLYGNLLKRRDVRSCLARMVTAAVAQADEAAAAADSSSSASSSLPPSSDAKKAKEAVKSSVLAVVVVLERMVSSVQAVRKYLLNLHRRPAEERFRRIRMGNKFFEKHVGSLPGADKLLLLGGFSRIDEQLTAVDGSESKTEFFMLAPPTRKGIDFRVESVHEDLAHFLEFIESSHV